MLRPLEKSGTSWATNLLEFLFLSEYSEGNSQNLDVLQPYDKESIKVSLGSGCCTSIAHWPQSPKSPALSLRHTCKISQVNHLQ